MCRFLLFRSNKQVDPKNLLEQFAQMAEKSRTPDGDRQEDGWGIAWKENRVWKEKKSLLPIWHDKDIFSEIKPTNIFVIHARSAGFSKHKGNLYYNQPYLTDSLVFVFNGMIRGVKLSTPLAGDIGAQKIFSLLKQEIQMNLPEKALHNTSQIIKENSQKIEGMNIGFVKDNKFYALCEYSTNKDYFSLRYFQDNNLTILCSEPLGSYNWQVIQKSEIIAL